MNASILRVHLRAAALLAILIVLAPRPAPAGAWSFGASGGAISDFTYTRFGSSGESFGPTVLAIVSADRPMRSGLSLHIESGTFGYDRDIPLVRIPEDPPSSERLSARFVPLAFGVRAQTPEHERTRSRVYAELSPTLFWTRFTRHLDERHGGFNGPVTETIHHDSFAELLPGIIAAAGVRSRISAHTAAEWGARYLFSSRVVHYAFRDIVGGDSRGLNDVAMTLGVSWTP